MSCNGCRVLRKGCSESCILRPCLEWIEGAEAQGHATVFVAKFFGRACLMSFISSVPEPQRPAVFQSLLFEACGRTVNPVNGAVGLMCTGRWHVCQSAVETVLRGGVLLPIPDAATVVSSADVEESCTSNMGRRPRSAHVGCLKRKAADRDDQGSAAAQWQPMLLPGTNKETADLLEKRRPSSPSEGSVTTSWESEHRTTERKLLNLFC